MQQEKTMWYEDECGIWICFVRDLVSPEAIGEEDLRTIFFVDEIKANQRRYYGKWKVMTFSDLLPERVNQEEWWNVWNALRLSTNRHLLQPIGYDSRIYANILIKDPESWTGLGYGIQVLIQGRLGRMQSNQTLDFKETEGWMTEPILVVWTNKRDQIRLHRKPKGLPTVGYRFRIRYGILGISGVVQDQMLSPMQDNSDLNRIEQKGFIQDSNSFEW